MHPDLTGRQASPRIRHDQEDTLRVLYDAILEHIPAPIDNREEPLQFQVSLLDYSDYVGRIGIGRVFRGTMKVGQQVSVLKRDGISEKLPRDKNVWIPWIETCRY